MNKQKTFKSIFILILVVPSIVVIYSTAYSYTTLKKIESNNAYFIDGDNISSVKDVLGQKKLAKVEFSKNEKVTRQQFFYRNIVDPKNEMKYYNIRLAEKENFINTSDYDFSKDTGTVTLAANSREDGKVIAVTLSWSNNGFDVKVEKGKGRLEVSDEL